MLLPLSVSPAPVVPLKKQTSAATLSELRHQLGTKEAVPLSLIRVIKKSRVRLYVFHPRIKPHILTEPNGCKHTHGYAGIQNPISSEKQLPKHVCHRDTPSP